MDAVVKQTMKHFVLVSTDWLTKRLHDVLPNGLDDFPAIDVAVVCVNYVYDCSTVTGWWQMTTWFLS
jgi:hypothetical protein